MRITLSPMYRNARRLPEHVDSLSPLAHWLMLITLACTWQWHEGAGWVVVGCWCGCWLSAGGGAGGTAGGGRWLLTLWANLEGLVAVWGCLLCLLQTRRGVWCLSGIPVGTWLIAASRGSLGCRLDLLPLLGGLVQLTSAVPRGPQTVGFVLWHQGCLF